MIFQITGVQLEVGEKATPSSTEATAMSYKDVKVFLPSEWAGYANKLSGVVSGMWYATGRFVTVNHEEMRLHIHFNPDTIGTANQV